MSIKRVNVFTASRNVMIPIPSSYDAANLQYDFDTNQILVVTKGLTRPVNQPQSIESSSFSNVDSSSVITLNGTNGANSNKSLTSPLTSLSFDLSSLQNGSQVNIEYTKTTLSPCTLTFPSNSLIRNQDGQEEPGLTSIVTGTDQSVFLISILKTSNYYLIAISRFKI